MILRRQSTKMIPHSIDLSTTKQRSEEVPGLSRRAGPTRSAPGLAARADRAGRTGNTAFPREKKGRYTGFLSVFGKRKASKRGFLLAEVVLTAGILVVAVVGLIHLFIYCSILSELSGNLTSALAQAQNKIEEIRNHNYSLITADYNGVTFDLTNPSGKGIIYVDAPQSGLLAIEVVVSWLNKNNRTIGEDQNRNGVLDSGEDLNGDGRIDSMANLITYIAQK